MFTHVAIRDAILEILMLQSSYHSSLSLRMGAYWTLKYTVTMCTDETVLSMLRFHWIDSIIPTQESALIEGVKAKFYERTTGEIQDKLNHNHPNRIFFDLFYPDTPRYAIPAKVEAAAKNGRFSSDEVVDFELIRKMGVNT